MNLVQLRKRSTTFAMPFRHREVGGKVLITNTEGNFLMLPHEDFVRFAEGEVLEGASFTVGSRNGTSYGRRSTPGR